MLCLYPLNYIQNNRLILDFIELLFVLGHNLCKNMKRDTWKIHRHSWIYPLFQVQIQVRHDSKALYIFPVFLDFHFSFWLCATAFCCEVTVLVVKPYVFSVNKYQSSLIIFQDLNLANPQWSLGSPLNHFHKLLNNIGKSIIDVHTVRLKRQLRFWLIFLYFRKFNRDKSLFRLYLFAGP